MAKLSIAYAVTAIVFILMDCCWLTFAGPVVYKPVLGPLLADKVDTKAAVAFYLVYMTGLVVFAVRPALASADWRPAAGYGALLGLVAYGAYDLTNQATLRAWSSRITAADMGWGAFASAVSSTLGFLAASTLGRGLR